MINRIHSLTTLILLILINAFISEIPSICRADDREPGYFKNHIDTLSSFGDRSAGTDGIRLASSYIKENLLKLGHENIITQNFSVPVLHHEGSSIEIIGKGTAHPIHPVRANVITPGRIIPHGIMGPLIYVGRGNLNDFNGQDIKDSIILMDLDSGKNWLHAASLGARALIYLDDGESARNLLEDKNELTPIQFPRFWITLSEMRSITGISGDFSKGEIASGVRVKSDVRWEEAPCENIFCLIEGTDPELREEMLMVEAFYDSTALIHGKAPGADESISVATLLEIARTLRENPPPRSVLLAATSGHSQTLAGMREIFWSLDTRTKDQKGMEKTQKDIIEKARETLKTLEEPSYITLKDNQAKLFQDAINERIKVEVDNISHDLMRMRLDKKGHEDQEVIKDLARVRISLRRLGWRAGISELNPEERELLKRLIPLAVSDQKAILADAEKRLDFLKSSREIRSLIKSRDMMVTISLHLSSHGDGFGSFNQGWLYPLKTTINRTSAYSPLEQILLNSAIKAENDIGCGSLFKDTLRPSKTRSWQSYFHDKPPLGGEVSALAGYLGMTFVTVNDGRLLWGSPFDTPDKINWEYANKQSSLVCRMIQNLLDERVIYKDEPQNSGFSTITGRANFIRHGELFPDQPAPGSVILAFQGNGIYHAIVDHMGMFQIRGVADKRHVLHKVIIEGYRFSDEDGSVIWAIEKNQTGKNSYRLKMERRSMETDLVMFACKGATLFNLLEPRTFRYMTRIQPLDGRREAAPMRCWWSRIDTRSSIIATIFLESGTPMKLTLSDSILHKKMILTNATEEEPIGKGYMIDDWPFLHNTAYRAAHDMWMLTGPRIVNLEKHGIYNERVRSLYEEGISALKEAEAALEDRIYDRFTESSARSWALATRVYDHVEKTQKDVLFGVLFYIALFIPFAFCLERLIFDYTGIHKRIIAFLSILILLIFVIYNVHPAFQLAYSPMVVILAFFIIGLSVMVTLIIYFRFEEEMTRLQSRAITLQSSETGRWKAFLAAFLIGVSNLRRRPIRTALTIITLIILTFTIMSFTSAKSIRRHNRIQFNEAKAYEGFLIKNPNWADIPVESLGVLSNSFGRGSLVAPRVWYEQEDKTRAAMIPVSYKNLTYMSNGLVGLSADEEEITGLSGILVTGRWFDEKDQNSVILSEKMAAYLDVDMNVSVGPEVSLWGSPYKVIGIFSGKGLQERKDLDGEPLTPVIFPSESSLEITEVEFEAEESGEEIQGFQTRYQHVPGEMTAIIPYRTLLSHGGSLKGIAVRPLETNDIQFTARQLVDRFGLTLFSGERDGTFLYNASDRMNYSGFPNIIIPLVISIFIVLNTMIGSVYERKREIAIYTSVGLAPSHVSFLFIAESLAFAVLSVVLGYLLAQSTAFLFSKTDLWAGITVNYSSLAGVGAMILVILVVLISVIYPSKVAGEIAIPDVNRSWKLPESEGETLELTLPFLLKYREFRSIGGYIFEYFSMHQDVSHGLFSSDDLDIAHVCPYDLRMVDNIPECIKAECGNGSCLLLHSRVWLAPFDLGITQKVHIQFCPSKEEKDFLEIKIRLERETGEANTWRRVNKGFLNQFRKQLLIWRSMDMEKRNYYGKIIDGHYSMPCDAGRS